MARKKYRARTHCKPPPPASLEHAWDKGKWHFDADNFPRHLPQSAGCEHIVAVLRFLDEQQMLTPEGREALTAGDDVVLLADHVKPVARAFLDIAYPHYLGACEYGQTPAIEILQAEWKRYLGTFDITKPPCLNAYQKLLQKWGPDLEDVFRTAMHDDNVTNHLRDALAVAPTTDHELIAAWLQLVDGRPEQVASGHSAPELLLAVLKFGRMSITKRLTATKLCANRLGIDRGAHPHAAALVAALNIQWNDEARLAWVALSTDDRRFFANLVNSYFTEGSDQHGALCAMRFAGNAISVAIMDSNRPGKGEGMTMYGDGRSEPSWDEVRRQVRSLVELRSELSGSC